MGVASPVTPTLTTTRIASAVQARQAAARLLPLCSGPTGDPPGPLRLRWLLRPSGSLPARQDGRKGQDDDGAGDFARPMGASRAPGPTAGRRPRWGLYRIVPPRVPGATTAKVAAVDRLPSGRDGGRATRRGAGSRGPVDVRRAAGRAHAARPASADGRRDELATASAERLRRCAHG